jgi:hypothetical protein
MEQIEMSENNNYYYNYSSNNNNDEDPGKKANTPITPFGQDKPWNQTTPLQNLNPGDEKKLQQTNRRLESLSNAYIEGHLKDKGTVVSNDVRNDLFAYYNVNSPDIIESTLNKICIDPRTIASADPNRPNSYYIKYNKQK